MLVNGPRWPSVEALREALAEVEPRDYLLPWGQRKWNGWEQLLRFAQFGVPCPLATDSLDEAEEYLEAAVGGLEDGYQTLWGRKLAHTQGTDIVGPRHPRWAESDFWVEPIEIQDEYRQHVWDGRCIRVGRKVQTGPSTRRLPIRSRRNGWTIDYAASPEEPLRSALRAVARGAVEALGYVGGAVDLIHGVDGQVYALEVNTAPSLRDENTLGAYVKAISKWAEKIEVEEETPDA